MRNFKKQRQKTARAYIRWSQGWRQTREKWDKEKRRRRVMIITTANVISCMMSCASCTRQVRQKAKSSINLKDQLNWWIFQPFYYLSREIGKLCWKIRFCDQEEASINWVKNSARLLSEAWINTLSFNAKLTPSQTVKSANLLYMRERLSLQMHFRNT